MFRKCCCNFSEQLGPNFDYDTAWVVHQDRLLVSLTECQMLYVVLIINVTDLANVFPILVKRGPLTFFLKMLLVKADPFLENLLRFPNLCPH